MKKMVYSAIMAAFILLPGAILAQSVEQQLDALQLRISELEQQVDEQQKSAAKHEKRSEKWAKIVEKLPKISGFVQAGFSWTGEGDGSSNFNIPHARLTLAGDISKKFDYKLQVEFSSPKLIDAYLRWKANPAFNVQFGQFHVPFTLEGPISPAKMEAIGNPRVASKICKLPDTRDLGVMLYGSFLRSGKRYLMEYSVGIFQGEGKNKSDANKSKDVIGRLKFFPMQELCVTASYSYGEQGAEYVKNERVSAGVEWKPENWIVRSEYLWHKQGSAIRNDGFYIVALYQMKKFAPVVRYSFYNQELESGLHNETSDFTVGINYTPLKALKFQANYTFTHTSAISDFSTVGLQATVMF